MVQVLSQTMLKLSKAHLCKIVTSHKISYDKILGYVKGEI